jgi:hypothetical protein
MPEATDAYMPILRWKRGEHVALENLKPATKDRLDPIFVVEAGYDPLEDGGHDPAFDARLSQLISTMKRHWPSHHASVDFSNVDQDARVGTAGQHFVEAFFDRARAENLHLRPVITLEDDAPFRASVAVVVAQDRRGATLRLDPYELDAGTNSDIAQLLRDVALTEAEVDLVVDSAEHVLPTAVMTTVIVAAIGSIANITAWRTLTLAAGSFPDSLTALSIGRQIIPRNCFTLWTSVRAAGPARLPRVGDYAIIHPEPLEVVGYMNPSASVKYTVDQGWLIIRGQGTRTRGSGGFQQFITHAQQLVHDPLYCGPAFSFGDNLIHDIATGATGPGNLETWVRIGVNHHIEFVVDRLASYAGP